MNEISKISVRQFTILVMFYTIGTTILVIPSTLAADAKQDAWIASIAGVGLGMLLVLLYNKIGMLFPDKTLVEYNEKLFGKWAGKIVSLPFVFFGFVGASTLLFYMGNFMVTQVMQETPIEFINILFASIVLLGLRLGLETMARSAEIFFPWFVALFSLLAAFVFPEIRMENMEPVLESGLKPIGEAAISVAGTASLPFIVLFMIFPSRVSNPDKARKAFLIATGIGGLFIVAITLLTILVLGTDLTERLVYPGYELARKINVGNFVERVESVMAGIWFMGIFYKTSFYLYACIAGLAQMIGIKDYRPLVWPFGMVWVVFSLVVYPDVVYMAEWDTNVFIPYAVFMGLLMPLFVWGVSLCKRKWSKKKSRMG
ncbi:GerAB/ArcD/ProY family transporter [Paenibacillus hamazuiensis]|uniref:GerAB/ArcD/ProY family transporter n=1 Tax=Paenibacillus hamazuiensis TaxID=2936508 RepID=UPI00200DDE53|nr:endospore germination permease [Paenibacillus hamazuiensis]